MPKDLPSAIRFPSMRFAPSTISSYGVCWMSAHRPYGLEFLEDVVQLLALRLQVALVVAVGLHLDRDALGYLEPEASQAYDFGQVVGKEADALEVQVFEDLGAYAIVPQVWGEAELLVGFDGVHAFVLEAVGLHLVQEAYAAAFLLHVCYDALALCGDDLHGGLQLLSAIAAQGVQSVAGQAGRVDADEHVVLALRFAHHQGDVGEVVYLVLVGAQAELAERGRQFRLDGAADLGLVGVAVLDDLGHRHELHVVLLGELLQVGYPGHRPVLFHNLADHTGRLHAC